MDSAQGFTYDSPIILLDLNRQICFFSCFCLFLAVFGCLFGCVFFWITFHLREWHHWIQHKILHQTHLEYWLIRWDVFVFYLVLAHFWLNFAVFLGAFLGTHFYSSGSSTIEFLMKFYTRNMYNIIGGNFFFCNSKSSSDFRLFTRRFSSILIIIQQVFFL